MSEHEGADKPGVEITQRDLCDAIAQRVELALLRMTGKSAGEGPSFAILMWTDGHVRQGRG